MMQLDDKIWFGKYKNKTIKTILEGDPSYIIWLNDEADCSFDEGIITKATNLNNARKRSKNDGWEDASYYGNIIECGINGH
jgi:hypothetical protein